MSRKERPLTMSSEVNEEEVEEKEVTTKVRGESSTSNKPGQERPSREGKVDDDVHYRSDSLDSFVGEDEEGSIPFASDRSMLEDLEETDDHPTLNESRRPQRPHVESSVPGAFAVAGLDGSIISAETVEELESPPTSDLPIVDDPSLQQLVTAHLVDTEEEELRLQELEEQNRVLREQQQNAARATVLSRKEMVKTFFNLRDPEYRRQRICGIVSILLALAATAIAIALTRGGPVLGPPTPTPTPSPTPEPTSQIHGSLTEFLSNVSFDGGAALVEQSTPQYKAAKWLANNANLDTYTEKQRIQRYALAVFYYSTNGDNWTTNDLWLDDDSECGRWLPEIICTSDGQARMLDYSSNNLEGPIPPELALLSSSLDFLGLGGNELIGTVPNEFQYLTRLTSVDVADNSLDGTIFTEVGLLSKLSFLGMADNQFSGTIPTELFLCTDLVKLRLGNNLQGTISSLVGNLTSLTELSIHDNELLNGTIPPSIGLLTRLTELSLYYNSLSGSIPSTIGLLTSLEFLYLDENKYLSGTLPTEIQNLTSLLVMELFKNSLSGPIPSGIGLLTNLQDLQLYWNSLTGSIPSEIGLLTVVEAVSFPRNFLNGTVPSEIGLMTSLDTLFLNENSLSGQIPNDVGSLTNLVRLSLMKNKLTGTVPSVVNDLPYLEFLLLYDNNLTGPFNCSANIPRCRVSCEKDNETCRVLS